MAKIYSRCDNNDKNACKKLFDISAKAHNDVFNTLLQVLDDGRLTDNKGVVVDFKNTIIILTSNIASDKIMEISSKEERKEAVNNELKKLKSTIELGL